MVTEMQYMKFWWKAIKQTSSTNILKEANGGFEEVQDNNCCGNLELNVSRAFNGKP